MKAKWQKFAYGLILAIFGAGLINFFLLGATIPSFSPWQTLLVFALPMILAGLAIFVREL